MGFFDSFILLGLFLFGLPGAWAVGWVLEKIFRSPFLGRLPIWIVLITLVAGVPIALRAFGEPTQARVVARSERVHVDYHGGGWWNTRTLGVRYAPRHAERADPLALGPDGDSVTISVAASARTFDRTTVGALAPVTYVSFRPSIGKMTDRGLDDLWDEMIAIPHMRLALGLFALIVAAVVCSRWAPASVATRWMRRAVWVVLGVAAGVLYTTIALTSPTTRPDTPVPSAAKARVTSIELIDHYWFSGRHESYKLAQPFDVVELEFTPTSFPGPVRTADAIDIASVRDLAEGATIAIHYDPAAPRRVRIDGATRTFEGANRRGAAIGELVVLALLVAIIGVPMLLRKRHAVVPGDARIPRLATR